MYEYTVNTYQKLNKNKNNPALLLKDVCDSIQQ